jgi:hypothetical protein
MASATRYVHGRCSHPSPSDFPLKLDQASGPGTVGADVGLDFGGQVAGHDEVDEEQLPALIEWHGVGRRGRHRAWFHGDSRPNPCSKGSRAAGVRIKGQVPKRHTAGPSWGRDPAVTSGQPRCPADSQNRS